jgi:small subunit ribosomal protein S8e
MAITQLKSRRKPSSGRLRDGFKKKLRYTGNLPMNTKLGERKKKERRVMGGRRKEILASVDIVNVYDPKTKKYEKLKIDSVIENKANRHFIRRNIITKGAIVKTAKGNVKITSRPGQERVLNAVTV